MQIKTNEIDINLNKKMRIFKTIFIIFLASLLSAAAQDSYNFKVYPVSGDEQAVLVLAPGMNMDGAFYLDEAPWTDFAQKNKLGIITLHYVSDPQGLFEDRKGYFYPDQGSGQALLDEIKKVYGKDLKIVIYGFSGGAQFIGRFIDWAPDRIIAWCAYSAQFWDEPKNAGEGTDARGIVACGDQDGLRWQPSFSFFYRGRQNGRPWIWLSNSNTGHNRSAKLEKFVRLFFDEELAVWRGDHPPSKDLYSDISNISNELLELTEDPGLKCPFRTEEILNEWKKIQAP